MLLYMSVKYIEHRQNVHHIFNKFMLYYGNDAALYVFAK